MLVAAATVSARTVTLSNVALPRDQHNLQILTGEASVLSHGGTFYFYFNDWGDCPGVNCCDSPGGCASCCFDNPPHPMLPCSNPYLANHTVRAYATEDLVRWRDLGVALPLGARRPGIEFRPCVVFNAVTGLFVMWYEDRPTSSFAERGSESQGYAIAVSTTPAGPFRTIRYSVAMPGSGRTGDFNIFVDEDGIAYHVRTGFDIVKLDANYTGPAVLVSSFSTPKPSEGLTLFKRAGLYYVTAGTGCCACIGGASIYVLSSHLLAGPWEYRGDVGSNPHSKFDPASPDNYITRAQGSAVLQLGGSGPTGQTVWLGNQWNTAAERHHDLLYWAPLSFDADGAVVQLTYQPNVTVVLSPAS